MILAAAAGLGSCSAVRHCKAPEVDFPAAIAGGAAADSLAIADMEWWRFYGDSTLCNIIRHTLANNKDMLAAAARVERMRQLYRIGKAGRLPGEVAPELKALAEAQGRKFSDTDPQANYPDELDKYRQMMAEKGWDTGQDDEELFEYAMHPSQYEAYKSGKAKQDFLADLQKRREATAAPAGAGSAPAQPSTVTVTVNGQSYKVDIAYGEQAAPAQTSAAPTAQPAAATGEGEDIPAPLEGKFYRVKNTEETPKQPGDRVKAGDILGYIEAMKTYNAIRAEFDGTITAILVNSGDAVEEDDVIMKIAKQ